MDIAKISVGKDVPNDINVIIEVAMGSSPVKYELDKDSQSIWVDRFLSTAMFYPCNYGFIPHTLSDDGDPTDVLVLAPHAIVPGATIRCRPIGVLLMSDEAGGDEKILAVPVSKLTSYYDNVENYDDLPQILLDQISHFFEHYKDNEKGKFVKVEGWADATKARSLIEDAVKTGEK